MFKYSAIFQAVTVVGAQNAGTGVTPTNNTTSTTSTIHQEYLVSKKRGTCMAQCDPTHPGKRIGAQFLEWDRCSTTIGDKKYDKFCALYTVKDLKAFVPCEDECKRSCSLQTTFNKEGHVPLLVNPSSSATEAPHKASQWMRCHYDDEPRMATCDDSTWKFDAGECNKQCTSNLLFDLGTSGEMRHGESGEISCLQSQGTAPKLDLLQQSYYSVLENEFPSLFVKHNNGMCMQTDQVFGTCNNGTFEVKVGKCEAPCIHHTYFAFDKKFWPNESIEVDGYKLTTPMTCVNEDGVAKLKLNNGNVIEMAKLQDHVKKVCTIGWDWGLTNFGQLNFCLPPGLLQDLELEHGETYDVKCRTNSKNHVLTKIVTCDTTTYNKPTMVMKPEEITDLKSKIAFDDSEKLNLEISNDSHGKNKLDDFLFDI